MGMCVECGQKAEHRHHVVPMVKGGTFTVYLCTTCHGKVHDKEMSSSYLTRLGIYKNTGLDAIFTLIFLEYIYNGKSIESVIESAKAFEWNFTKTKINNHLKKMASLNPNDLFELMHDYMFVFCNERVKQECMELWLEYSPYPVNLEAQHA